jgi:hypothetical protein
MADTRVQLEVETWIRQEWMSENFGQKFSKESTKLTSGGAFEFDAVSEDRKIVAVISTGGAKTATGKSAAGKIRKIRSDMFFLLLADTERRIVVLTEQDMFSRWEEEKDNGRVPPEIEFCLVEIPPELRERLQRARMQASNEVSPGPESDTD